MVMVISADPSLALSEEMPTPLVCPAAAQSGIPSGGGMLYSTHSFWQLFSAEMKHWSCVDSHAYHVPDAEQKDSISALGL